MSTKPRRSDDILWASTLFPCESFEYVKFTIPIHVHICNIIAELEMEENIINWSLELCEAYGSRLYALWNRSAGDCLLDSVLQATWGVFDKDNTLRLSLSDSLSEGERT